MMLSRRLPKPTLLRMRYPSPFGPRCQRAAVIRRRMSSSIRARRSPMHMPQMPHIPATYEAAAGESGRRNTGAPSASSMVCRYCGNNVSEDVRAARGRWRRRPVVHANLATMYTELGYLRTSLGRKRLNAFTYFPRRDSYISCTEKNSVFELGTLVLGIPVMLSRTERENALLRSRFLFVTTGAPERRVEAVLVDRLLQGLRLHDVGVNRRAMDEGIDVHFQSLGINVHDEIEPQLLRHAITKLVHCAEFPRGIDVQQRKGRLGGMKRLHGEM